MTVNQTVSGDHPAFPVEIEIGRAMGRQICRIFKTNFFRRAELCLRCVIFPAALLFPRFCAACLCRTRFFLRSWFEF